MTIQSVDRAVDILLLFDPMRPSLGITEISRILGLTKPTVHGLVNTLTQRGLMARDPKTRKYSLGLKITELGVQLNASLKINRVGAVPAHQLAEKTRHMARIAIWDDDAVLVTLSLIPGIPFSSPQIMGPKVPAYCCASGKAMLSALPQRLLKQYLDKTPLSACTPSTITDRRALQKELEEARHRGFASDREEYMSGLNCIGAPIFDHTGIPAGAISLSGASDFFSKKVYQALTHEMLKTADEISTALGHGANPK